MGLLQQNNANGLPYRQHQQSCHLANYCIYNVFVMEQELSYRKQIARKLRTQFVEGIYRSDYA